MWVVAGRQPLPVCVCDQAQANPIGQLMHLLISLSLDRALEEHGCLAHSMGTRPTPLLALPRGCRRGL